MIRSPVRAALIAPFGLRRKGTTTARVLPVARELSQLGATVRVIIPPWDDPSRSGECWSQDGYEVVHTRVGPALTAPLVIVGDISRRLREWEPDVVHAFKPIGYSGLAAWAIASRGPRAGSAWRRPLVIVDVDDLEGRKGWAGRRGQEMGGVIRGVQERLTIRAADGLTAASRWLGSYARRIGQPHVYALPNGHSVDARNVDDDAGAPSCGAPRLLWYTRFTEANPRRVAALVAPLLRADPRLRLAVVGDEVDEGDSSAARRAFASSGVQDQVDWLGYVPDLMAPGAGASADAVAIYPMDDDLVNRARCPSKIPQLMALGVPIVAERVGEAGNYLHGLAEACLVDPGAAEDFRARVSGLLADASARSSLSADLRTVADRWRWERTCAGLLDWYQQCLGQRIS